MPADDAPPKNDRTDLEVWLRVKGPDFLRRNAANIVLGIAVLIAAGFFLYSRLQNKRAESNAVQQNVAAAYDYSTQLKMMLSGAVASDAAGRERQQRAHDAVGYADYVLNSDAATPAQRAIAQLVKADIAWQLANAPAAALATTRPVASFTTKTPEAYLDDAAAGYTEILRSYADEPEPVASALLSLAAIEENRGNFDEAAKWYRRAIDERSIRPAYHDVAIARLAMLDELRKPYLLVAPASQPANPTTAPMIFRLPPLPATAPSSSPAPPSGEPATTTSPSSQP